MEGRQMIQVRLQLLLTTIHHPWAYIHRSSAYRPLKLKVYQPAIKFLCKGFILAKTRFPHLQCKSTSVSVQASQLFKKRNTRSPLWKPNNLQFRLSEVFLILVRDWIDTMKADNSENYSVLMYPKFCKGLHPKDQDQDRPLPWEKLWSFWVVLLFVGVCLFVFHG